MNVQAETPQIKSAVPPLPGPSSCRQWAQTGSQRCRCGRSEFLFCIIILLQIFQKSRTTCEIKRRAEEFRSPARSFFCRAGYFIFYGASCTIQAEPPSAQVPSRLHTAARARHLPFAEKNRFCPPHFWPDSSVQAR